MGNASRQKGSIKWHKSWSSEIEPIQMLVSDSSPRISSFEQVSEYPALGHGLEYDAGG